MSDNKKPPKPDEPKTLDELIEKQQETVEVLRNQYVSALGALEALKHVKKKGLK